MTLFTSILWARLNLLTRLSLVVILCLIFVAIGAGYLSSQRIVQKTQNNLSAEYRRQLDNLEYAVLAVASVDGKAGLNFDLERLTDFLSKRKYGPDVSHISFRDLSDEAAFDHDINVSLKAPLFFSRWCGLEIINVKKPLIVGDTYYGLLCLSMSPNRIINLAWENYRYLLLVIFSSLAIALFSIWVVLRKALRPLLTLAEVSKTMAGGNMSVRVPIAGSPELRIVLLTFNKMASSIQSTLTSLQESESRFRQLTESLPQLVWTCQPDGPCDYLNRQWIEFTGVPEDKQLDSGWLEQIHPDDRASTVTAWGAAVDSGANFRVEFRIRRHDGEYRWFDTRAVRLCDAQGRLVKWVGSNTDITENKQAEEEIRRLNAELEQRVIERTAQLSALNKEMETFSYSVSHDLRAPLRSIDGFSRILLENYQKNLDDKGKAFLEKVCEASRRMSLLIDDMLKLSKITRAALKREAVDLSVMIGVIAKEHQMSNPNRVIDVNIREGIIVKGDPHLINIAMKNLVGNAFKFTGEKEHPKIEFGTTIWNGETACFIRDNGAGFEMAYANKLFGAFQRLHTADEFPGTGIGLATVQRVINRHGGKIWAEGEKGKGAVFYFTLP